MVHPLIGLPTATSVGKMLYVQCIVAVALMTLPSSSRACLSHCLSFLFAAPFKLSSAMDFLPTEHSLDCCEVGGFVSEDGIHIKTFATLVRLLQREWANAETRANAATPSRESLEDLLGRFQPEQTEVNRYSLFSSQGGLPYTRNLVHQEEGAFTLLVLCWNSGYESLVHSHPVDACFVVPLSGKIVETRFGVQEGHVEWDNPQVTVHEPCQDKDGPTPVSFLADSLGLVHKIANGSSTQGAITLHLYCPPFQRCKVWTNPLSSVAGIRSEQPQERTMVLHSVHGLRCAADDAAVDLDFFI